jgi:polysaccharide biosynthesis/export protein
VTNVCRAVVSCAVSLIASVPFASAAQPPPPRPVPPAEPAQYTVAPGDVLHLAVWKEPELTTDLVVRLDGRITVPLAGEVKAGGRTTDELTAEIRSKLRAFLEVPQVTLTVAQANSARFYVIGEVGTSGAFPLSGSITVAQALALAGGFREFAKREGIVIIRRRVDRQVAIPFNFKDIESGQKLEQNIFLEAGDTIVVP